jgi:hypothetical protein
MNTCVSEHPPSKRQSTYRHSLIFAVDVGSKNTAEIEKPHKSRLLISKKGEEDFLNYLRKASVNHY